MKCKCDIPRDETFLLSPLDNGHFITGFADGEAPRPTGRGPIRGRGRGAQQRKNKGLRAVKHHAPPVETLSVPEDVVPRDDGIRVCGQ